MLDTAPLRSAPLRDAYRGLLDAAVVLINAATVTAVSSATAGTVTTYDNRLAQDAWTGAALRNRIRHRATPALICGVLLFPRRS